MPATRPALLQHFSLLLLVGRLHLALGSTPHRHPSDAPGPASASPDTPEAPSPAAAATPSLLLGAEGTLGAFRRTIGDPTDTEGPAIMSSQKTVESSDIRTSTSSSHPDSMDGFRIPGDSKGWTLETGTNSPSASAIGTMNTASYTETLRAGDSAQPLTSGSQPGRGHVSPSSVGAGELNTVTLSMHSPKIPVPLFPEDNPLDTGSSYQADTQDADHLLSTRRIESTDSPATVKSDEERTLQFLTDVVTLTVLAGEGPVSQRELTTQAPSSATHSRGRSSTPEIHFPDSSDRIALTQATTTAEDIVHQPWSISDTERRTSSSYVDRTYVSSLPGKGEKRTLHILRQASRTTGSSKTPTVSSNEIFNASRLAVQTQQGGLSPGDSDFTEAAISHSQAPLETTVLEDGDHRAWSGSSTERNIFHSPTDGASGSGLSVRSGEITLRTIRDVSSSASPTQIFTSPNNEISSTSDLSESSSVLTPVRTRQMNLSPGYIDLTETTFRLSQVPLETTGVEDGGNQPWRGSDTESSTSSSHADSESVPVLSVRSREGTLHTLRNVSSFVNATEISATSNKISGVSDLPGSILIPVETILRNSMPGETEFPTTTYIHSHTSSEMPVTEDNGDGQTNSSDTARGLSSFPTGGGPAPSAPGTDRQSTTWTRDINISSAPNTTETSVTTNTKISSQPDLSNSPYAFASVQTGQTSLSLEDPDFTRRVPTYSQVSLETTGVGHDQHNVSNFDIGTIATQTEDTFSTATVVASGESTIRSLANGSKFTPGAEISVSGLADTTSSDLTPVSSATAQSEAETATSTEVDFMRSSEVSGYSASTTNLSRTGTHRELVNMSSGEERVSSAFTDSIYLSSTVMHSGGRTLRSLQDNSTSTDSIDNSTYNTDASQYLDSTLTLTAMAEIENHMSFSEEQFTTPSTESSLKHSSEVPVSVSPPQDSSTVGKDHNSVNDSNIRHLYTESFYSPPSFSDGEAQTVHSSIDSTFAEVVESTSSYEENTNSTELGSSLLLSGRSDYSVKDFDITKSSTQSLASSRIPTFTSFQSEHSDTGTNYHPTNGTDPGKRSSSSQTDSMYLSTTFTRGGERTLLSLPSHGTSAHSSESSTFFAEMLSPSETVEVSFSATQSNESSTSSSGLGVPEVSTEPLAVHSLKTSEYASTLNERRTTHFYLKPVSTSTGSLSFSSSATPKQGSLTSTQLPTFLSSSESYFPSSSSDFPSPFSPSPEILLTTFPPRLSSATLPSLSLVPSSLPPNETFETSFSVSESEGTAGIDQSITKSSHTEFSSQTDLLRKSTDVRSTGLPPLLYDTTEHLTNRSSTGTLFQMETKSSEAQNLSLPGVEKTEPVLTTSPVHLLGSTLASEPGTTTASPSSDATTTKDAFTWVEATSGKGLAKTAHTTSGFPVFTTSTDYLVTSKPQGDPSPPPLISPTKTPSYTVGIPTKRVETSRATTVKGTNPSITTTHLPIIFSSSKTTEGHFPTLPVPAKPTRVPWVKSPKTSPTSHGKDLDECLSNPCPPMASCSNTQGSLQCICSLGYQMEKGKCSLVRTFVGQFPLSLNATEGKYSELLQVEEDITSMLNSSLSTIPGYYTSVVKVTRQSGTIQVFVQSTFSLLSNVTYFDIFSSVLSHIRACQAPTETCHFLSKLTLLHRVGGLCKHKDPKCDKETSVCVDSDGIAVCQCKPGYFKYNKLDHSCRACEDGYKLQNDTCVRCPFGLGGFNCGNPYQLITIVIAAAGGGLLLIMGIALIVTCCQKNKNDISKLIFKSGDFQMSPYAEYPKNPRAQDWGRESIEMQENGSTKNLLQMTDVYYMPTNLRNPEVERNGLYPPYTGLPGSRHSCIYPGQYNPSFVSDDSRRRDYF